MDQTAVKGLLTKQQKPSASLVRFIDTYWMVENHTHNCIKVPIVPDGCVDIVIKNDQIFLVGLMEVTSIKTIEPGDRYLGIRFRPGVASALLTEDISFFNDKVIALYDVDSILHDGLMEICSKRPYDFEALDRFWIDHFIRVELDGRIESAIALIMKQSGDIDILDLSRELDLSSKQLERLFASHVGLTPKKFARIIRFFHTHKHLTKEGLDNLCLKVLERGYYDQAHFNREYKALTGLKPTSEVMSIFYNT